MMLKYGDRAARARELKVKKLQLMTQLKFSRSEIPLNDTSMMVMLYFLTDSLLSTESQSCPTGYALMRKTFDS